MFFLLNMWMKKQAMSTEGNWKLFSHHCRAEEDQEHDFGPDLHLLQRQLVREKSIKAGLKVTEDDTVKIPGQMGDGIGVWKPILEYRKQFGSPRDIKGPSVPTGQTLPAEPCALEIGSQVCSTYIYLHLIPGDELIIVNFIFWQIAARLCTSRVSLDSLEMQIGSLYASQ